jgi:hypothetical protein
MKRLLASFAVMLALGCTQTTGSGVSKTETRTVGAFSEIAASSGLDVKVHVGGATAVTVTGDDNIVPLVETEVSSDRLRIGYKSMQNVRTATPVHVDVTTPKLGAIDASSGVHLTAEGVNAETFSIHVSSGVDAKVSGTAGALTLHASSGVNLDAGGLASKTATVHASSGSNVTVRASDAVQGEASSGSDVTVLGAPATRTIATSSGANVGYK